MDLHKLELCDRGKKTDEKQNKLEPIRDGEREWGGDERWKQSKFAKLHTTPQETHKHRTESRSSTITLDNPTKHSISTRLSTLFADELAHGTTTCVGEHNENTHEITAQQHDIIVYIHQSYEKLINDLS